MSEAEKQVCVESEFETEELPQTIIRRIVKAKLSQLSSDSDLSVQRQALTAFSETARIFIHYLSATANDVSKEAKRQTVNAEDVFKALEEMEFRDFIGPLRSSLKEVRKNHAEKKSSKVKEPEDTGRKNESPVTNGRESENGDDEDSASE